MRPQELKQAEQHRRETIPLRMKSIDRTFKAKGDDLKKIDKLKRTLVTLCKQAGIKIRMTQLDGKSEQELRFMVHDANVVVAAKAGGQR
jgi:hypothetical protein